MELQDELHFFPSSYNLAIVGLELSIQNVILLPYRNAVLYFLSVVFIVGQKRCALVLPVFIDNPTLNKIFYSLFFIYFIIWKMTKRKFKPKSGYKFTVLKFFKMRYKE